MQLYEINFNNISGARRIQVLQHDTSAAAIKCVTIMTRCNSMLCITLQFYSLWCKNIKHNHRNSRHLEAISPTV